MLGRLAVLAAALLGACALIGGSAPAAGATPPCPEGKYCTDDNGFYELSVPPLPNEGIYAPYRDCVWHVHVDFGDGTSAEYTFEGEVGLSGSHTFPHYGEYAVAITLSNSHHKNNPTGGECPNPLQKATVLYRDSAKLAEEEAAKAAAEKREQEERQAAKEKREQERREAAKEKKEREEREKARNEKREGSEAGANPNGPGSDATGKGGHRTSFWTTCARSVYAHKVGCAKAQKVVRRAGQVLSARGSAKVAGFTCRYDPRRARPLSCRRRLSRILGPPAAG